MFMAPSQAGQSCGLSHMDIVLLDRTRPLLTLYVYWSSWASVDTQPWCFVGMWRKVQKSPGKLELTRARPSSAKLRASGFVRTPRSP